MDGVQFYLQVQAIGLLIAAGIPFVAAAAIVVAALLSIVE